MDNIDKNVNELPISESDDNEVAFSEESSSPAEESENTADAEKPQVEQNSISADLIRGHINTIILRALYERDKYGYEIINDIESKSHGQYTLKQPTLYSALKRLENQGYIKAYWKTDEVTLGGRRKYFTLTEAGKEITEKNLAEWEYSRTIIDSLISDKSFDFANPAPTPVDFKLLRDSVSRVPTVKANEQPAQQTTETSAQEMISQLETHTVNSVSCVQTIEYGQPAFEEKTESKETSNGSQAENEKAKPETEDETARKRVHENYLKLISVPVSDKSTQQEDIVPGSQEISSEKLIYANKPETERDYKNLIDGIFFKTVYNGSTQTNYHSRQAEKQQRASAYQAERFDKLVDRGTSDGVSITPSNETNSSHATKTTYNKGLTLFKSSAVVLGILILEAIICFACMDSLVVNWLYPTAILAIGIIQFAIFAIMAFNGHNTNCVRPTGSGYIATCVILTIVSILIISMLSFLFNMNTAIASDVLKMLVIPAISALNITVFAVTFKLFLK